MNKTDKIDDSFYRDSDTKRVKLNRTCRECIHPCKQSYKAELIACRKYESKYKERKEHE